LLTLDGETIYVASTAVAFSHQGQLWIKGSFDDITQRKQAEAALRQSEEVARRMAHENAIVAEIGRIISSTLNIEDTYERFAEKARQLISFDWISISIINHERGTFQNTYKSGDVIPGRGVREEVSLARSLTEEAVRRRLSRIIEMEGPDEVASRFPNLLPFWQRGYRSFMGIPLISNDQVVGVLHIYSKRPKAFNEADASLGERISAQIAGAMAKAQLFAELKRATEDLVKAKDASEAANRAKSDFLANMSHELRTPLHHIIGFTELVLDKQYGDLNQVQEEYLNDVLQSSRHLLSLINDILDLSKVEAGKLELEAEEIPLQILLEGSLSMVKEKAMKHRIRLSSDINGIPETIQADERKLKQILYNLLSNAVKFTPDGGSVVLSARCLSFREGQWFSPDGQLVGLPLDGDDLGVKGKGLIDISVQDSGIGIKGEDLQLIFNPFEQADNSASRKYQGSGLGLSLTKRLVELHGGRIWAESEGEGKGSKFILLIPV
jgi:signal transduction histidine kinase